MITKTAKQLKRVTEAIFTAAGASAENAREMGEALVGANLTGHDSHGVIRIPAYIRQIREGTLEPGARPEVIEETATTALVDGKLSFGHVSARFATDVAIRKAKESKTAVVSIVRCNHIGRLGQWGAQAAAEDVIAFVFTGGGASQPGQGTAAPFGGAERLLSTNPISIGVPGGNMPDVLVDFATTVVAEGKIQVARAKGAELPPGCILDKNGRPSTNPNDFYDGGVMLPFGGHKGYALAMVVEMLCGVFTPGDQYSGNGRRGGTVIWAADAFAFRDRPSYEKGADAVLGLVKKIRPAEGFKEVLLPGEPEQRSADQRLRDGIPIAEATWEQIVDAGKGYGVDVEATARA